MEFIHTLTMTSSLCSGFTLGCVIYEHIHIKQLEYRPRNNIELLETLYGLAGAGCFFGIQHWVILLHSKYNKKIT